MDKKVLLIWDEGEAFLSRNITEQLKAGEIETECIGPHINDVAKHMDESELLIFYVNDAIEENKELQVYVRDCCVEKEKKLCLAGYPENIEHVKDILGDSFLVAEYPRPIDVRMIVAGITGILNRIEAEPVKKHILLVDDDPMTLRAEKTWFDKSYKVSIVNSATMAFTFLAKNTPDLILLDYDMPLCNGVQFLEMLHAEENIKDVPVIFLTGKADGNAVHSAIDLKPAGYLLKSMPPAKIVEYVDEFFQNQEHLEKQNQI